MKKFDVFRLKRSECYRHLFSSRNLCAAGLIMMPAFLFNPSTSARIAQFLLFWFFAWLSGKKNNPLITLIIIMGIVIVNLFMPYGEELFRWGKFKITEGALIGGIRRAVTLEGLIMLSRVCVRPDLTLPGTFGALVSDSFRMFEKINEKKRIISRKNIIGGIDQLMIELSNDEDILSAENTGRKQKRSVLGTVLLIFASALIWFITIIPQFFPNIFTF